MQQGLLGNLLWFINQEEGGIIHPHTQRRFFIYFFFPSPNKRQPRFPCCNINARLGTETAPPFPG